MVVQTFQEIIANGRLGMNLRISFARVIVGFLIGASSGMVIGFFMGLFKKVNQLLTLFVSILRPIPTIALIPVFILILGIGETSKYAIIAIGSFWSVLLNTINGVESVDPKLLEVGYAYRIPRISQVFRIVLPSALPSILTGLRIGISSAWVSVIAAEMLAASRGIGYMITYARENSQVATMYAGVITIGIVGLVIDRILIFIQKFYLRRSRGIVN
jgi:sulfonate transport system permease protein